MKTYTRVGQREMLVKRPLFVDGISRAGKFLIANVLGGIDGIEPVQYTGILEEIPFLERFSHIKETAAVEILRCEVDTRCYEMLIGRNLNYRKTDKSSIFHVSEYEKYIERTQMPDEEIDHAIEKFWHEERYSFFILHEVLPNICLYFKAFPEAKIIHLKRNPLDIVLSWYKRGLGKRWGTDPKHFQIPFRHPKGPIPWFAYQWADEYFRLSEMERAIRSLYEIIAMTTRTCRHLSAAQKENILTVYFEDILRKPHETVNALSDFLGKKKNKFLAKIFQRENLPNTKKANERKEKYSEVQKHVSKMYFTMLVDMDAQYQEEYEKHT